MSLGSGFPPEFLRGRVRSQLRPRAVIKLVRKMDDGDIHEKRFVVLHVDEMTVTCVINSQISGFVERRPELLRCQVSMSAGEHPFMDHDSHVDCSRTRIYRTDDVVRDLANRPEWILGRVSPALTAGIVAALKFSPTLSAAEVELLLLSLGRERPL